MIKIDPTSKAILVEVKDGKKYLQVSLLADTSSEVKAIGTDASTVVGMASDEVLAFGSSAFIVQTQDLVMLDSTGTWH